MSVPTSVEFDAVFYSKRTDKDGYIRLTLDIPVQNITQIMRVESWFKKLLKVQITVGSGLIEEQGGP